MPLVDIAAKLGVLDTQVRKWKSLDEWNDLLKGNVPKQKGTAKRNVPKSGKKIPTSKSFDDISENLPIETL